MDGKPDESAWYLGSPIAFVTCAHELHASGSGDGWPICSSPIQSAARTMTAKQIMPILAGMTDKPSKPLPAPSSGSPLTPPPMIGGPHPEASNPFHDKFRGRNRKSGKGRKA